MHSVKDIQIKCNKQFHSFYQIRGAAINVAVPHVMTCAESSIPQRNEYFIW